MFTLYIFQRTNGEGFSFFIRSKGLFFYIYTNYIELIIIIIIIIIIIYIYIYIEKARKIGSVCWAYPFCFFNQLVNGNFE